MWDERSWSAQHGTYRRTLRYGAIAFVGSSTGQIPYLPAEACWMRASKLAKVP